MREFEVFDRVIEVHLGFTAITDAGDQLFEADCRISNSFYRLETALTDTGLAFLSDLPNLDELSISNTAVTDAGMLELNRFVQLTSLALDGTAVTDAGLVSSQRL